MERYGKVWKRDEKSPKRGINHDIISSSAESVCKVQHVALHASTWCGGAVVQPTVAVRSAKSLYRMKRFANGRLRTNSSSA